MYRGIRCPQNNRGGIVNNTERIEVRCFGNFEVYYQGKPLVFKRRKAKEILAYLIDKEGNTANTAEMCIALWEDSSQVKRHYFRTLIGDLKQALRQCGMEEVLIAGRDSFAVDVNKIDCDYYHMLNHEEEAREKFRGEYMRQYSWAEVTLGYLMNHVEF